MSETISINVTIGDRMYPMKVRSEDEPIVREAEQLLNHKYSEFQLRFSGQEKLDYLAMSSLMNLVEVMKQQQDGSIIQDALKAKLSEVNQLVMDGLKRN